jgi:hypothetical protein
VALPTGASDLAKWDICLIRHCLLSPQSYRELEREVVLNNGAGTGYSLGLDVGMQGGRFMLEHSGEVSGFVAENMVFPDDSVAIVVLTNQDASSAASTIANGIASLLFTTEDKLADSRTAQAKAIFEGLQKGTIDRSLFTSNANFYFSDQALKGFSVESWSTRCADWFRADENCAAWWDDVSELSCDLPESNDQGVDIRDAGREAGAISGGANRLVPITLQACIFRRSEGAPMTNALDLRRLLTGGDRRSIADSNKVRRLVENDPSLVGELVALTKDKNWLVVQRALDLLEKLAHEHPDWIEPHKRIFIGPLAESDKWEIRLQIVRALPLFQWTPASLRRVEDILRENVDFPQTFVRAWALDGLATLSERKPRLRPLLQRHLKSFEASASKALQARARNIRKRLKSLA